jgi:phosphatidylinositol alpha 1,6-mannosyltransferase
VWEKDLMTLAETYKIISSKRDDIKFILAGDGPVGEELVKLMPDAIFLGQQTINDLSISFASADVFVFPSTTETFGNVTIEAMASGLPPICVREGGAYGMIQDGINGLIAEPRDPEDLTSKINFLLDNSKSRIRIANSAFSFAQTQSWEKNFQHLFESYSRIINNFKIRKAA